MSRRRRQRQSRTDGFQVGPDLVVEARARILDADGDPITEEPEQLRFVVGYGQVPPNLEQGLAGCTAGDVRHVELEPEEAFGRRDPQAVIDVDRDDFPPEAQPGDRFEAEAQDGKTVILTVLEVGEELLRVDTNHPLAGQRLHVEVEVGSVLPAAEAELLAAQTELERRQSEPTSLLIAPERLLQGPPKR